MTTIVSFNFNNSALYIKPEQTLTRLWSASVYNAPPLDVALSFLTVLKTGKLSRRLGLRSVSCRHITSYFTVLPARCCFSSSKWANKPRQFHWSTAITLSLSVLCTDITLIDRINVSNKALQEKCIKKELWLWLISVGRFDVADCIVLSYWSMAISPAESRRPVGIFVRLWRRPAPSFPVVFLLPSFAPSQTSAPWASSVLRRCS